MSTPTAIEQMTDKLDFNELLRPYTKNWKWFVASLIIAIAVAFIYLRYATPEFGAETKIQIIQNHNSSSEMIAFGDLERFSAKNNFVVQDEIEILNSLTNFIDVVKILGINISVKALGNILDTELYMSPPVKMNFLMPDSLVYNTQGKFKLKILSEISFSLSEVIGGEEMLPEQFDFGKRISTSIGDVLITPQRADISNLRGRDYEVVITPVIQVAKGYRGKMMISVSDERSNIVSISLADAVPQKALDILNTLVAVYNQKGVDNKKDIADRTSEFIDARIAEISLDLSTVDDATEEYKSSRGITDISSQSNVNLNLGAASRQQLQNARVELNIAKALKQDIDNMAGFSFLPANIEDNNIASVVSQYNTLVRDRNQMLRSSNERNPVILNYDEQLIGLKQSLQSSLDRLISNLTLEVNNLSGQLSVINSQIYTAPEKERVLRDISRQQQTIESLYLYMLQTKVESQITFATSSPKSIIIDRAYLVSPDPVSPKKPIILLAFIMLGLLVPFSVIYVKQLLDNKIHNKMGLEKLVGDLPVLGELPKLNSSHNTLVKSGDRSVLAESLRILRTNLDFLIKTKKQTQGGSVIFVTSSVPGEGKTFVASNLAMIYANANKKVLLLGGDIRNPKINKFYSSKNLDKLKRASGIKDNKGLTDYLIDDTLTPREIISTMLVSDQTVDIIHSGKLMPNPSELLMSIRLEELVKDLRSSYDYIIVDTAPMVVVSDTMLISKYADHVLYVTRAEVTNLKVLNFPLKMYSEGKVQELSFIVNGVKSSNLGYGGRYGYGYGQSAKKWWKV